MRAIRMRSNMLLRSVLLVVTGLWCGIVAAQVSTTTTGDSGPARPPVPVLELKFSTMSGPGSDRQVFVRFQRALETLRTTAADKVAWHEVLQPLEELLKLPEDQYLELASTRPVQQVPGQRVRRPQGSILSLWVTIDQLIGELPREGRRAWLERNGETAAAELKAAIADGDLREISRVARQFVHTPAGHAAAERIGIHHLDRGATVLAIRLLEKLRSSPHARTAREPLLSLKTAAAWASLGREDRSYQILVELDGWLDQHPRVNRTPVTLLGEALEDRIKRIKQLAVRPVGGGSRNRMWSHFLGNPQRTAQAEFSPVGSVLWDSPTNGFHDRPTDKERTKFTPAAVLAAGETDVEVFPDSDGEMAGFIEAGLAWLDRYDLKRSERHIPAGYPVIADGLAVFRTYNRIRAVELDTGDIRWESFMVDPAWEEQFDVGNAERATSLPKENQHLMSPLNRRQNDFLRIRSRHDRTTGTLTTDGRFVYFIEECGVPSASTTQGQARMQQTASLPWNRLCCAELQTGILLWEIGGPGDQYPLPGADHFFLGPPTIVSGQVFVLGERDSQVRLFCLQPDSGKILWSQEVAEANVSVRVNGLRRTTGASPTEAGGLLVCPIVDGSVVAFDPELRRIAWTWRYSSNATNPAAALRRGFRFGPMVQSPVLQPGDRWQDLALVDTGGMLLITPPDSDELFCIDAVSGQQLWSRPRESALYLATVFESRVVLVDPDGLRALDLVDGEQLWQSELFHRQPSGRGLRTEAVYHLPVLIVSDDAAEKTAGGAIAAFDLRTGNLLVETGMADSRVPGNLVAANGTLVSQRYGAVVALQSVHETEHVISNRLSQNAKDAEALTTLARLRLHQGRIADATDVLKRVLQSDSQSSTTQLVIQTVLLQMQSSGRNESGLLNLLDTIPLSASDQIALANVRADLLIDQGKIVDAFKMLLNTPVREDGQAVLVTSQSLTQAGPQWQARRFAEILDRVPPEQLLSLEGVTPNLDQPDSIRQWLERFGSSREEGSAMRLRLAATLKPTDDLLEIESLLSAAPEDTLAAQMEIARNEAWLQAGRGRAVRSTLEDFRTRWSGKSLPGGQTAEQLIDAWQKHELLTALPKPVKWPAQVTVRVEEPDPAKTEPGGADAGSENSAPRYILPTVGVPSPVVDGWIFEFNDMGVTARDSLGRDLWTIPPDEFPGMEYPDLSRRPPASVATDGHLMVVMLGTGFSVFDLSGPQPQRLWSRTLLREAMTDLPVLRYPHAERRVLALHDSAMRIVGLIDELVGGCLVYRSRETLHVVDAITGDLLWRRTGVRAATRVFGDDRFLTIADHVGTKVSGISVADLQTGRIVRTIGTTSSKDPDAPTDFRLVGHAGRNLLGFQLAQLNAVTSYDPFVGKRMWQHTLTTPPGFWVPAGRHWAVGLDAAGNLRVCDTRSGQLLIDTTVPATPQLLSLAVHETDFGLIVFAAARAARPPVRAISTRAVHSAFVGGTAHAVDCRNRKVLWNSEMPLQFIALPQPRDLPFVVLSSQKFDPGQLPGNARKVEFPVVLLDTRTGEKLTSVTEMAPIQNFRPTVDLDRHEIAISLAGNRRAVLSYKQPGKSDAESQP